MTDSVDPNATNNVAATFLPRLYRTDANNKFLQATVEQLSQKGTVTKLNGYIGRQTAKATTGSDVFISAVDNVRQSYQLEPSIVINDKEGNNSYFKDYQDYINRIQLFGGNTSNHQRLNSEEFYSWDPQINWDKFVNFQNYYWLEPSTITIGGPQQNAVSTYTVATDIIGNTLQYVFTPDGISDNPTLTLYRGQTYVFKIDTPNNPFSIKTARSIGSVDRYETGVLGNAVETGTVTFLVPNTAPDTLYYQSETEINIGGMFKIDTITANTSLDIEQEILGKSSYTLSNGEDLSNGMLVKFSGNVTPTSYSSGKYYVEGVGVAITLIPYEYVTTSEQHEYILINKASLDKNPWSRTNRWVHADVLIKSDTINSVTNNTSMDQTHRAIRPIIEFSSTLKLFNYGTDWLMDIDFLDQITTDALSFIEGSTGYYIDGIEINSLSNGKLVIITNDMDDYVRNNIYRITFVNSKIHLELVATPDVNQVVYVKDGNTASGKYIWFDGSIWNIGQQKTGVNHAPLFDVVDDNLISFGDKTVYNGTTFNGTYVFSYKIGSGSNDTELGFPLSYRNINNIGDIVFNFDFVTDMFDYKETTSIVSRNISKGYLTYRDYAGTNIYTNGWVTSSLNTIQAGVRVYKNSVNLNNFNIDIFNDITNLDDLIVRVYVNGIRLQQYTTSNNPSWVVVDTPKYKQVILVKPDVTETVTSTSADTNLITISDTTMLTIGQMVVFKNDIESGNRKISSKTVYYVTGIPTITTFSVSTSKNGEDILLPSVSNISVSLCFTNDIQENDILTIRTFAAQAINENGHYEIPNNLQNNPLNGTISNFTLGEVINHVDSIVDNLPSDFVGTFPGWSNIRDLGSISQYGTKFVRHSGPSGVSMYHLTSDTVNIVKAVEQSRDDYNSFKRNFITVAETLGVDTDIKTHVDLILQNITKNIQTTSPYYFSDMVPFGASVKTTYEIAGFTTKQFPLLSSFDTTTLSNQAVGVYVNGEQLVVNHEYIINAQGFVVIKSELLTNDEVTIYEYENTDGCFIPETPSKLGIWPVFDPKIYKDTTLVTPQWVIQGHDGSQVLAYGTYDEGGTADYRDALILELEKRIYNNIKITYDTTIFDIKNVIPNYSRNSDYSLTEFNNILAPSFYKWASLVDVDFTTPLNYNSENPFTFNYTGHYAPDGRAVPGYWRGIYGWILETDRPHLCPWEILGLSDQPTWWETVYGPAPYTSDNLIMWSDISKGLLKEPGSPVILEKFIKTFLINNIPVDEYGNLRNPIESGLARGIITDSIKNNYVFGDVGPAEGAWRRSSHYPFSVILTSILLSPSKTLGVILDRSRISRNLTGQLVFGNNGSHIIPSNVKIPSVYTSSSRVQTSGIINYIVNYIVSENLSLYNQYAYDLANISYKLSYRVSGFTSKHQFNLILDSKSPLTSGNVFIPQDDYSIILNTSSPTKKITYSGVIISKLYNGYSVKGYSQTQPYFSYYNWTQTGSAVTVGGISEPYVTWTVGKTYNKGQIVKFGNSYYRATTYITGEATFDVTKYQSLTSLPIIGGKTAFFRKAWDKTSPIVIPYNSTFDTIQEVVDFLIGYGVWLQDQGFIFDDFNTNLNQVSNWETSAKEFMFWTTQNWSAGQDIWNDWQVETLVTFNSIVRYQGNYYRSLRNIQPSATFEYEFYEKLDGLSTVGSSVISLSPAAAAITFSSKLSVVDDITSQYNNYELLRVDGQPILPQFLDSTRDRNLVTYKPNNDDGIYNATFYLVQKEQVVIINNTTMFNDLIYDPTSGYKQDRIKISAYVSSDWYGGFDIPGFIFDEAKITKWTSWKDYALGEIVQYQSFYYSANLFITGSEQFDSTQWTRLTRKPESKILPNWTNLATQFTDFYSLEDEHFDSAQQTMAQHLIGYQKRQYLNNIIQDDVSEFKFYQGMITEKGTQNVFNKLFGVLASENKESLTFYEEWAVRVGQYGASSSFNEVEFTLYEEKFKNNPQTYELVERKTSNGYVIQQLPSEVYVKPSDYSSNIWPVVSSNKKFLRPGGHVRPIEATVTLTTISEIVNQDITSFNEGDYIWCTFEGNSWNIYRYTSINNPTITDVTYDQTNNELTISLTTTDSFIEDSYIGIDGVTGFSNFYKVISYTTGTLIVSATGITVPATFTEQSSIKIYTFVSQRVATIDDAANILHYPLSSNEMIWVDSNANGKWSTWAYNSVYTGKLLPNPYPQADLNYGRYIATDITGTTIAVSTAAGEVYVYKKTISSYQLQQEILKPFISNAQLVKDPDFGSVIAISDDSEWMAIGSPKISHACTELSNLIVTFDNNVLPMNNTAITFDNNLTVTADGSLISGHTYTITAIGTSDFTTVGAILNQVGEIFIATGVGTSGNTGTVVDTSPISAGSFVIGATYTITTVSNTNFTLIGALQNKVGVVFVAKNTGTGNGTGKAVRNIIKSKSDLIYASNKGLNSVLSNQGVVSLYKTDSNQNYFYIGTFVSPQPVTSEFFGSSLEFGKNELYIGATGWENNTGKVYKISYTTVVHGSARYEPEASSGTTVHLAVSPGFDVTGMYLVGTGFTSNQQVLSDDGIDPATNTIKLTISSNPDTQPTGIIQFVSYQWQYDLVSTIYGDTPSDNFGSRIKLSNEDTLAISSNTATSIYKNYELFQTITAPVDSITISNDGQYIAISDILYDGTYSNQGKVTVYSQISTSAQYTEYQVIENLYPAVNAKFGANISFMDNYHTLVIHSIYAGTLSSHIDVYDKYDKNWAFSERLPLVVDVAGAPINIDNDPASIGFCISAFSIFAGTPYVADTTFTNSGIIFEYTKSGDVYSWGIVHQEVDRPDISKIKKVFLYNKKSNEVVTYIDIVDPLQGKIPGPAEQEISYKTFYDPAVYSVGNANVNVDTGIAWTTNQVGKLWWDVRTAKFVESYDADIFYRTSTWNTLLYGASIDIYEWVETSFLPAAWDAQADTEEGLALGISGTSLYGNSCYSIKTTYDNVSKTLKNTYYYWVKNKTIVPSVQGRYVSAQDVSSLISSPVKSAYKYISFTGPNTFDIANVGQLLSNNDIILSVQYWTIDNTEQNIHSQWKIISNDPSTVLPSTIEDKWFDSLCGSDVVGRVIPDSSLSPKLRYGVENRPRQSMFINRFEALKMYVEQANLVLLKNQISSIRNLSNLEKYDQPPAVVSGIYDVTINTNAELQFVTASSYRRPELSAVVVDGKIISVTIINAGLGYVSAPTIEIIGSGINAVVKSEINVKGQISNVIVVDSGEGYTDSTSLIVRNFAVLVLSDAASNNAWSIYEYYISSKSWVRKVIQTYDTKNSWYYVDWYADGFNQFTAINHAVNIFPDLQNITTQVGDTIKVRLGNNGQWILLRKVSAEETIDWTISYDIIGIQDGTIQLSSSLYNSIQYDGTLYDSTEYDINATIELRNILSAIKTDIFINELSVEYLNLFFNSVRYAYTEQNYIDWIVKTSFVKANHSVGTLNTPVTFKNDNLVDFESYVSEVKPYRTKVREYISSYNNIDTGDISVTDFDLPPVYTQSGSNIIEAYVIDNQIQVYDNAIQSYPWKSWYDNVGFTIVSVVITDPGYGYLEPPTVDVISSTGHGAILYPVLGENGRIDSITIHSPGTGFLEKPTIVISDPPFGQTATAVARIGQSLVRTVTVKLKFDRITSNYYINKLQEAETFTATSGQTLFTLRWAPDIKLGYSSVTVNGQTITNDLYKLHIVYPTATADYTYSRLYGTLEFSNALSLNDVVEITYNKDASALAAADRIHFYYNSSANGLGSDLSQLMTGVDYGGVIIDGISFEINKGWGSLPYLSDRWDSYDPTFKDYSVEIVPDEFGSISQSYTLPYIPDIGTVINVYHNKFTGYKDGIKQYDVVRIDDLHYATIDQTNGHALMISPVISTVSSSVMTVNTDGTITINIPTAAHLQESDVVVFRESTSDGSIKTFADDYDTSYDGGNLAYTTATGFTPGDTIIDGESDFITPISSHAPEEVVPGQIVDALEIKVFEQNSVISGNVKVEKYVVDGVQTSFDIRQKLNSQQSAIVTVETFTNNNEILTSETVIQTLDVDYTIDFTNNLVIFNTAPVIGSVVSIFSIGVNSTDTLDFGYIISDGISTEYTTKTMWETLYIASAFVNGVVVEVTSYKTANNIIGLRFASPPELNAMINYIVVNSTTRTFTITSSEQLAIPSGGLLPDAPVDMDSIVGTAYPNENNMIVIVDQIVLLPTNYIYTPAAGSAKPTISFNNGVPSSSVVTVFSSFNNSILGMDRSTVVPPQIIHTVDTPQYYNDLTVYSGVLTLPVKVLNENYLWVIKNGTILTPDVDYILNTNKISITLLEDPVVSDIFDVITFDSNTTTNLAFMQFKDMLNRMHYKDIDVSKQSLLTTPLTLNSVSIYVQNSSVFDLPNPEKNIPGVVEIGAERIEYFKIEGNKLTQLRRATLGTAAAPYSTGAVVQNIGPSANISYSDKSLIQNITVTSDMINNGNLIDIVDFIPAKVSTQWTYDAGFTSSIPANFGQCDEVEVFVGGYDTSTWTANVTYAVGDIVMFGVHTYKCLVSHISSANFTDTVTTVTINQLDNSTTPVDTDVSSDSVWVFFIDSIRLKKKPYKVFNINKAPTSPEGDVQFDADFSVNGTTKQIRLTNPVPVGTRITVVKQTGTIWNNKYAIL